MNILYLYQMPSQISSFEYDIFISYRHNDNKYDGWVTEFVANLRKELEATLKGRLTIYFDENPHDGLLETHHVVESLSPKIKSFILIPIVSQTYCDPESYAWRNEFIPFISAGKNDQVGMNVKLPNGNVASRILPVKINQLEDVDQKMLEEAMGQSLRSIDFIYQSPGVNRPLRSKDDEIIKNPNQILYRDQINKVANAVKEIISALKNLDNTVRVSGSQPLLAENQVNAGRLTRRKILLVFVSILAMTVVAFAVYRFIPEVPVDKSIAVLAFRDMSPNHDQEWFSDGISEELLNLLARSPELRVIARTSSFSFKGKDEDIRSMGSKLGVAHILEGSVRKSGNTIRITVQLINTKDGSHLWSENYDRNYQTADDILKLQDEIAATVVEQLKVKMSGGFPSITRWNPEAYSLFLQGRYVSSVHSDTTYAKAADLYRQALSLDSGNARLWAALSYNLTLQQVNGFDTTALPAALAAANKAIQLDKNLSDAYNAFAWMDFAYNFDWKAAMQNFRKALELDPNNMDALFGAGFLATTLGNFQESERLLRKAVSIDPLNTNAYSGLGGTLVPLHQFEEGEKVMRKAIQLIAPEVSGGNYFVLGTHLLLQGKFDQAIESMKKERDPGWKAFGLAQAYYAAGRMAESNKAMDALIDFGWLFQIGEAYAFRGNADKAFEFFEIAYRKHDAGVTLMQQSPFLEKIKKDPRYNVFVRVGFEFDF